jgi:hypothetical protein
MNVALSGKPRDHLLERRVRLGVQCFENKRPMCIEH